MRNTARGRESQRLLCLAGHLAVLQTVRVGMWAVGVHANMGRALTRASVQGAENPPSTSGGSTCLLMEVKPTMLRVGGDQGGEVTGGKVNPAPALHFSHATRVLW